MLNVVVAVEERWDHRGWSAAADAAGLIRLFADWARPIRRLVRTRASWTKYAMNTVDGHQPWTSGRVAMLGDAAHAMTPFLAQGGAMAIEDAAVLAARLGGATDVPSALAAYEAERKPRVVRVAEASAQTGDIYHYRAGLALTRDIALTLGGSGLIMQRNDWIYRWQPPETAV